MQQIKEKQYPDSVLDYTGDILLVGINYDKKTKEHQCLIERYEKNEYLYLIKNGFSLLLSQLRELITENHFLFLNLVLTGLRIILRILYCKNKN